MGFPLRINGVPGELLQSARREADRVYNEGSADFEDTEAVPNLLLEIR